MVHSVTDLQVLTFGQSRHGKATDVITCTPTHPFFVQGKGWVLAGQLALGSSIVTRAGPDVILIKSKSLHVRKPVEVYNFTIVGDHTYFVGTANGGIWVHNDCGPSNWGKGDSLDDHFARHGSDFNAQDAEDYAKQANDFYKQSGDPGNQVKYDFGTGQTRVYQPSSNTFGSYNPDESTATFYKPTGGQTYFDGQAGSTIP